MASRKAGVTTSVGRHATREAAKQALYDDGMTLKEFAKRGNFKYRVVSDVIRGVNKGLYGEGHKVAVALGIK